MKVTDANKKLKSVNAESSQRISEMTLDFDNLHCQLKEYFPMTRACYGIDKQYNLFVDNNWCSSLLPSRYLAQQKDFVHRDGVLILGIKGVQNQNMWPKV